MSRRAGLRDKWRHDVLASELADAVKVTLIALSMWMSDKGYVSVPRETLADVVGKHPRKIGDHIATAVRVGLLHKIGGGYRGVTAQYVAVLSRRKVPLTRPPFGQEFASKRPPLNGHLSDPQVPGMVAVSGAPITGARVRASVTEPRQRHDGVRNVRVSPDPVPDERRQRREVDPGSPLAAILRRLDGRPSCCAGLRGAA